MTYDVYFVTDAEEDLFEIYNYVATYDLATKADKLLAKIKKTCENLSSFPDRDHVPQELKRIGVLDYKEIHCPPYRIIYQIFGTDVYIHCILDSRRDIQQLLENRLLR